VRKFHLVYAGIRQRARTLDLETAFETLESDLRQTVAAHARQRIFVHAGVVGIGDCAVLLPGRSCSGKTTLVRELVRAGAVYYSDEFAVIDSRGRVHPFLKPLSIREGERIRKCPVEELGGASGARPLTACAIVFTEHRPGARWRPTRQTTAMGVLNLLNHSVPVRRRPKATLAALEKLVRRAVILKGPRGEAAATARSLLSRAATWGRGAHARAE
jgi:serine kinase of HPr protein (carbohydrate metabolism regulator)